LHECDLFKQRLWFKIQLYGSTDLRPDLGSKAECAQGNSDLWAISLKENLNMPQRYVVRSVDQLQLGDRCAIFGWTQDRVQLVADAVNEGRDPGFVPVWRIWNPNDDHSLFFFEVKFAVVDLGPVSESAEFLRLGTTKWKQVPLRELVEAYALVQRETGVEYPRIRNGMLFLEKDLCCSVAFVQKVWQQALNQAITFKHI